MVISMPAFSYENEGSKFYVVMSLIEQVSAVGAIGADTVLYNQIPIGPV